MNSSLLANSKLETKARHAIDEAACCDGRGDDGGDVVAKWLKRLPLPCDLGSNSRSAINLWSTLSKSVVLQ